MTYRTKLLINFTAVFVVFAVVLMVFQHHREVVYREQLMAARLRSYADIVAAQHRAGGDSALVAAPEMRTTIISRSGQVAYESDSLALLSPSNHNSRPEVREAWELGESYDVRQSETTKRPYFYFAKNYGNFQVRVALPYNEDVQDFMRPENIFTIFVLLLFPFVIVLLLYLSDRFGKAIAGLRQFIESANRGLIDYDHIRFPKTELGDIGSAILDKYRQLEDSNKIIAMERERLALHFLYFEGGIAIFSPERHKLLANATFLQYVNAILDNPTPNLDRIWETETFRPVIDFLNARTPSPQSDLSAVGSVFRYTVRAGSASYAIQVLVYGEGSFELTLTDVTQAEKTRTLKQQMSNNITHELRTPVSSIRGYLETLLSGPALSPERQRIFLERSYAQAVRLSDLIRDVALISKAEEAPDTLPRELVNLSDLAAEVQEELATAAQQADMQIHVNIPDEAEVEGNYSLLYAVLRNLMENSIRYAGPGAEIFLECYRHEAETLYFRYYDTGAGVPEEHLPRLFERFYRVSEGRTREAGGTGLGLSIVRNAVQMHGGTITVRNRKGGGLEFLFTLRETSR